MSRQIASVICAANFASESDAAFEVWNDNDAKLQNLHQQPPESTDLVHVKKSGEMFLKATSFQVVLDIVKSWHLRVNGQLALVDDPTYRLQEYLCKYAFKFCTCASPMCMQARGSLPPHEAQARGSLHVHLPPRRFTYFALSTRTSHSLQGTAAFFDL